MFRNGKVFALIARNLLARPALLAGVITQLDGGVAVGVGCLHHDVERRYAEVVHQCRAPAKDQLDTPRKALVQLHNTLDGQTVAKDNRLAQRIDTLVLVKGNHTLGEGYWIARIVA